MLNNTVSLAHFGWIKYLKPQWLSCLLINLDSLLNSSTIYILRKILGYNHLLKVETKKCLSPILIWIFNFWHMFSWAKKNLKDIEVSVLKSCFISFLQKMYEYIFESFLSQNRLPLRIWILSIRVKTKESMRQVLF